VNLAPRDLLWLNSSWARQKPPAWRSSHRPRGSPIASNHTESLPGTLRPIPASPATSAARSRTVAFQPCADSPVNRRLSHRQVIRPDGGVIPAPMERADQPD
jgi:hypothetical protein